MMSRRVFLLLRRAGALSAVLAISSLSGAPAARAQSVGLQAAYNLDNTITTSGNTPIAFTLSSGGFTVSGSSPIDFTGGFLAGASPFVFEGATADAHETTLTITDPTASRTITFPNASGTVAVSAAVPLVLSSDGEIACPTCVTSVSTSLQDAYGNGNTITTASSTPLSVVLASGGLNISGTDGVNIDTDASSLVRSAGSLTLAGDELTFTADSGSVTLGEGTNRITNTDEEDLVFSTSGDFIRIEDGKIFVLGADPPKPVGTNGAMYYDEFHNRLRCFENGFWKHCDTQSSLQEAYLLSNIIFTSGEEISFSLLNGGFSVAGPSLVNFSGATFGSEKLFALEGVTIDDNEIDLMIADPTADRIITIPNASGTFVVSAASPLSLSSTGHLTCPGCIPSISLQDAYDGGAAIATGKNTAIVFTLSSGGFTVSGSSPIDFTGGFLAGASPFVFEGATADAHETTLTITDPTADRTITFPNASGTVALTGTSASFTTLTASTSLTIGSGGSTAALSGHLSATGTAGNGGTTIPGLQCINDTITVTGAVNGDTVIATPPTGIENFLLWGAFVSASDTVTIRICNIRSSSTNSQDRTWRVDVWKH